MVRSTLWAIGLPGLLAAAASAAGASTAAPVSFNRDIRPILSDACYHCHGPDETHRKGKLRLDTRAGAFRLRDGKAVIVPGKSGASELFLRLQTTDASEQMPPPKSNRKLTPQQIDTVRRWIDEGAAWDTHWAFVKPVRPPLPPISNARWPRNGIDHFVLARLDREKLMPAPEAARETLLRRVTLDLTGLPPTLAELDQFLTDPAPDAYEKAVDRLLRSPRYGERMALEWLDAARYADSNGYQADGTRTMWPWRDWLIAALNRNTPFNQLTLEMIAGDLLPGATTEQRIATGFHRNHMLNGEGGRIAEESRVDYVVDRVDTTATVWLGLTLGCCRCHNHKYDPFTQKEYYQLFAYFNNLPETGGVDRGGNANPVLPLPTPEEAARIEQQKQSIAAWEQRAKAAGDPAPTPREWQRLALATLAPTTPRVVLTLPDPARLAALNARRQLDEARKALDQLNRSVTAVMVMEERPQPRDTFILQRGAYDKHGDKVAPSVITSLAPQPSDRPNTRLALAHWLVAPENPLTARVTVNRYWQQFLGTGLVRTTEDFGVQGESPSHPELLDWLASEFVATGWDIKALHKLIVTSATYRQSSALAAQSAAPVSQAAAAPASWKPSALIDRDPDNRLLARGPRHRLSSAVLRDQALFLSGLLVDRIGGKPVKPYQPPGLWEDFSFGRIQYVQDKGEALYRRSIYTFWRRTVAPTSMFDTPLRQVCVVRQARTNTPLHALILLNDVTFVEAARKFAERVMTQASTPDDRIALAFRLAAARRPRPAELAILRDGYQRTLARYQADRPAALELLRMGESPRDSRLDPAELAATTGIATVILNLDEVVTKE